MSETKKKKGRPSKFNDSLRDYILFLAKEKGLTDEQIAKTIGIAPSTFANWKADKLDFLESLKDAKYVADELVVGSLYRRATGYSHPEVKVSYDKDRGKWAKTLVMRHYPPSEVAAIFWLKNRDPENWREKQEIDLNKDITVTIGDDEQAL